MNNLPIDQLADRCDDDGRTRDLHENDRTTLERAAAGNFALVVRHVMRLYAPGCSSVSAGEAHELALSVAYALGHCADTPDAQMLRLGTESPLDLHRECLARLNAKLEEVMDSWREVAAIMPPIRNVALRDTLASIGRAPRLYDKLFAAHEVPCDIQYQLSRPVSEDLQGLDYLAAWLAQLRWEVEWIARFDTGSCIRVLERVCPDHRGLHVNLYDLLSPHESELRPRA